jgi:glycerophosphoryl diester phosphodiesterase
MRPRLVFILLALAGWLPAADLVFAPQSDWEVVSSGHRFAEGMAFDRDGHFYFTDVPQNQLFKIDRHSGAKSLLDGATGRANGIAFGPDGRLYGCANADRRIYAWNTTTWEKTAVAEGTLSNDLVILRDGTIFYTEPNAMMVWRLAAGTFAREAGIKLGWKPNGITVSRDEKTLLVAEFDSDTIHGFALDGKSRVTGAAQPAYKLAVPVDGMGKLDGMLVLADGRLLSGTSLGTQIARPAGAPAAEMSLIIIPSPGGRARCNYARISPDGAWLYTAYAVDVLRRRLQPGFGAQLPAGPARSDLFLLDAQTPQGLRELFKPTADPLPILSAHRGGAGAGLPENCLATFEATLRHTWSMLEIDLRTSKDGTIVLMHDPTLDRTTNGTGPVKDRTLAELRQLRLKDRQGNLTDHRIPTLDEAMKWAKGKTILVLDKKEVPVEEVVRVITEHQAEAYAMMMAYSIKDVTDCHGLNRDIMMEAMLGAKERFEEFDRSGVPWGNIIAFVGHTQNPDADLCRRIREKGASCMAGTSRNIDRQFLSGRVTAMESLRSEYRSVLDRGVTVIETDIPREVGPLLFGAATAQGAKARFFRAGERQPGDR